MCGISLIYSLDRTIDFDLSIKQINRELHHRGPDDCGIYLGENFALGHTRLSIIDLSAAGHQPFVNQSEDLVIVYNGEIYNYLELKEELADYSFKSKTDTEVILAAYKKWGSDCVKRFNGMFSFVIFDREYNVFFIARDQFGIKPLYYYHSGDTLIVSSEIKAIFASGIVKPQLARDNVYEYFLDNYVKEPNTIFQGISTIEPGMHATYDIHSNSLRKCRYWEFSFSPDGTRSEEYWAERLEAAFKRSIKLRQMSADVDVGVFLSGGMDSSVITALMKENVDVLKAYTIGFNEKEYDESDSARTIAKNAGIEHTEVVLTRDEFIREFGSIIAKMDQPSIDGFNTYFVSKYAAKNVKVSLSGLGGDELFSGYRYFTLIPRILKLKWLLNPFVAEFIPIKKLKLLASVPKTSTDLFELFMSTFTRDELCLLFRDEIAVPQNNEVFHPNILSELAIKNYMIPILLRDADVMGMANSMEVRFPFLDIEMFDIIARIPPSLKLNKGILHKVLAKYCPGKLFQRKKKGFVVPIKLWIKDVILANKVMVISVYRSIDMFNLSYIEKTLDQYLGSENPGFKQSNKAISLYVFAIWYDQLKKRYT
ncbi:MAG TPA: asparagine synthase (glutamine-hydrolyzing) [Candidatus Margulisbacteria bacterium]|nr:MAG: asparagine synthase (glutamine-hydrolyzing) [Candidatus Margulisbacteria bacterium GWD2_39_127]OGI04008.1 MAG: asparagine synthase (glutamine-hydrolyzing) [Candidatus Margulisbacteria bacterium GWF2_38_17]OGI06531.1 MAG: asparagine synthase (glutamine-hydrolyzing) [Candidatus Margulisbacteria bacterium GWE2_39_32]HAR62481.1 asparagine synthase (glutamine-hydrolyzing) [Candidatus Margulisiibacteriota bacterium]HCT84150.1 asparagine synthase (glutamine-hydrolyzing) [Candidatus Margulisiib